MIMIFINGWIIIRGGTQEIRIRTKPHVTIPLSVSLIHFWE